MNYYTSLTPLKDFPLLVRRAQFILEGELRLRIREGVSPEGLWGDVQTFGVIDDEARPMPCGIDVEWISIIERKRFCVNAPLDTKRMETLWREHTIDGMDDEPPRSIYKYIAVGIAPSGGLAVWLHGRKKQILVAWIQAEDRPITAEEQQHMLNGLSMQQFCDRIIRDMQFPEPAPVSYDSLMQQYIYRIVPELRHWNDEEKTWADYALDDTNKPQLAYLEVKRIDGTYDRLHDGALQEFHSAGCPRIVSLCWNVGKKEYSAYFFFDDQKLMSLFRKFSTLSLDGKINLLLQIDPIADKFVVSLNATDIDQPTVLNDVDVLAFRNRFEYYRSKNYHQEKDAWNW